MADAPNRFILDSLQFWALGDRLLIQEDDFKSGYECTACGGSGKLKCPHCTNGTTDRGFRCKHCEGACSIGCGECGGKGGMLVIPETSQRRPTTGRIVSIGEKVTTLSVGDNVMYSNFAGYVVDFDRAGHKITMRILHESEILCGMTGQLELRTFKGKSEIATFQS